MKFSKLLKIIKIYKFSYYIILVISNKTKIIFIFKIELLLKFGK